MSKETVEYPVLRAKYDGTSIYLPDGTYLERRDAEMLPPLFRDRWDQKLGRMIQRPEDEVERKAREAGANIIATEKRKSGSYALFRINPSDLTAKLKGPTGKKESQTTTPPAQNTAPQTNVYWGSYDFDPTKPLGQRFVVSLSNPERSLPRDSLEQLGEISLYHWQDEQRVRRETSEVEQYALRQFGENVIIVPSSARRKDQAHFRFYKEPEVK